MRWKTYVHPDDLYDAIVNADVVDNTRGADDVKPLYEYADKDDERLVYSLCEVLAAGINTNHEEWLA